MRRTDTVCSPGLLRRLLAIADDKPLGESPIVVGQRRRYRRGEWRLETNGQWRFWAIQPADLRAAEPAAERAEAE